MRSSGLCAANPEKGISEPTFTPAERFSPIASSAHGRNICEVIKDRHIADGLYFVSIDIIAGKLVEINCVNPGGIPRINRLNHDCLEKKWIDFIEQRIGYRMVEKNIRPIFENLRNALKP